MTAPDDAATAAADDAAGGPGAPAMLELDVGPVAHGGSCVARHEGRVVFVRHALPGERVRAAVTQGRPQDRYWRADAVEVLTASPDRVQPPCRYAGPGRCGGCDWQHASLPAQRRLKADVVAEQLRRLAGLDVDLTVEPAAADDDGLGWRTRVQFAVDAGGRLGYHRHRSHSVVAVDACPIAHADVTALGATTRTWPGAARVEVVAPSGAGEQPLVVLTPARPGTRTDVPELVVPSSAAVAADDGTVQRRRGRAWVREEVEVDGARHAFRVTGSGFWQVHPRAAQLLVDAVLEMLDPQPGERALDLYCGVGLFAAALASRLGPQGAVIAVESDPRAVADARRNLHAAPTVRLEQGRVERVLPALGLDAPGEGPDVVVLDPSRAGAGRDVVRALAAGGPRAVAYVACDPATLARDVAFAAQAGYRLERLRAFDLFPMTAHVECVALLVPA